MKKPTDKSFAFDAICFEIASGSSVMEFEKLKCPQCGSVVHINFHPDGHAFAVRCGRAESHIYKQYEVKVSPPEWREFIGGVWLD